MRPQSLFNVCVQVINGQEFNFAMKEFIDESFYARLQGQTLPLMCLQEPPLIGMPTQDVFVAGIAEILCGRFGVSAPTWTRLPERFLKQAVFICGKHTESYYLQYTPVEMRRRLLFCGEIDLPHKVEVQTA